MANANYVHLNFPKQSKLSLAVLILVSALCHWGILRQIQGISREKPNQISRIEVRLNQKKEEPQNTKPIEQAITPTAEVKTSPINETQSLPEKKSPPLKKEVLLKTTQASTQKIRKRVITHSVKNSFSAPTRVTKKVVRKKRRVHPQKIFQLLVSKFSHPTYPKEAIRRGIQGDVVLEMIIESSGKILQSKVIQSSGSQFLDQSALWESHKWSFKRFKHPKGRLKAIKKISFKL